MAQFNSLCRMISGSGALQDRFGTNAPSKFTRLPRTFSSQTDRPDRFGISEEDYPIDIVSQHFVQNNNSNGDLKSHFDTNTPEPFEGGEDTSDPCAGLDLNDTTNENDLSKNTGLEFWEESVEDERFPLPSEPLDKG